MDRERTINSFSGSCDKKNEMYALLEQRVQISMVKLIIGRHISKNSPAICAAMRKTA